MGAIGCTGGSGDGVLWRLRSLRTLASCSCWVSIDIKVLTDLGLLSGRESIDIQVLWTCSDWQLRGEGLSSWPS